MLYEMLAGHRPFRSESDETLIYAIRHDQPRSVRELRDDRRAGLAAVASRCLEKDPNRRYQRAGDLLADVRILQRGGVVRHPASNGRVARFAAVGVLLALAIVAGVTLRAPPDAGVHSLAVLPMTVSPRDPAQEYLSDGMADLLIDRLSQLSGLHRVISRTSVAQYRNTQKSSRQIGRELGVDALVEMSVTQSGRARPHHRHLDRHRGGARSLESQLRSPGGRRADAPARGGPGNRTGASGPVDTAGGRASGASGAQR